jgi:hypothetical protein
MSKPAQEGRKMLRLRIAAALVGVGLACTGMTAASAAPVHAAAKAAAAACPAGYFRIQNYNRALYISGNGVNNPVTLTATGNCWEAIFPWPDPVGGTGHEYQNGAGHCLWANGDNLDVGAACKAGHPNEQFYGSALYSAGWTVELKNGSGSWCGDALNGPVTLASLSLDPTCFYWNFPT